MDLSIGVIRMVLFVSNGIFACTGVAILTLSAIIYKEMNVYSDVGNFIESQYAGILITLMVVGSLVIVVTLLGLYGTVRENQKILMAFAVMLFVIYVCEIVLSTLAFLRSNDIDVRVRNAMVESFDNYKFNPKIFHSFNQMQRKLQCCGVKGPREYWSIFMNSSVPASCCTKYDGEMCFMSTYSYMIHQTGCFEAVRDFVARSGVTLGAVTLSLAFSEVLAIVFALLLIIQLYREEKKMGIHLKPGYKFQSVKTEPRDSGDSAHVEESKASKKPLESSKTLKFKPEGDEELDFELQDIEVANHPSQEDELTFQDDKEKLEKQSPGVTETVDSETLPPKVVEPPPPPPETLRVPFTPSSHETKMLHQDTPAEKHHHDVPAEKHHHDAPAEKHHHDAPAEKHHHDWYEAPSSTDKSHSHDYGSSHSSGHGHDYGSSHRSGHGHDYGSSHRSGHGHDYGSSHRSGHGHDYGSSHSSGHDHDYSSSHSSGHGHDHGSGHGTYDY